MAPSPREYNSWMTRPLTREKERERERDRDQAQDRVDRPLTRDQHQITTAADHALMIPSRNSSLHSRIAPPLPSQLNARLSQQAQAQQLQQVQQRKPKTLTHAYMVCGLGREPSQWTRAPAPSQGKIGHMRGAVSQFWLPEILGSSPRLEHDRDVARSLYAAMRACFPHDVEICTGRSQPHCVHHAFVLQQDATQTLYGIALRVWSRADDKRAETIRELRRRTESDFYDSPDETYWIPYCLSFLSRYPLYDLLGDYLRGMWIHWNKATNLFHAEEVSRILSFPAPRLNDLVRIDMKDFALCYQFPASPTGFQNFALWPLFNCLSIPNIVGVLEAAVSATRRIIFVSHYAAMLTLAAETVRHCIRIFDWSGLYVPVVHARHVKDLVHEPGPYMLGVTAECRSLFTAPSDALVVDLDRNYVMTSAPPTVFSVKQRNKMITRLTDALSGDVETAGVPVHLRSAYGGGKLIPAGQIIVMRGEIETVEVPPWWNQDAVMTIMDHTCEKLRHNGGLKAIFGNSTKKPLRTKISLRHLNEIVRERNQYSRDVAEGWHDFCQLKSRLDNELGKVTKRNNFLVDELESWKQQFLKFSAFAEKLTKETQDLKAKIDAHVREHRRLTVLIDQHKDEASKSALRLSGTEKQRDNALEAVVLQQTIAEELDRERKRIKKELHALTHANAALSRQRDESHRVVIHLRALIDGQTHHMEHIVRSLGDQSRISGVSVSEPSTSGRFDISDISESVDEGRGEGAGEGDGEAETFKDTVEEISEMSEDQDAISHTDSATRAPASEYQSSPRPDSRRSWSRHSYRSGNGNISHRRLSRVSTMTDSGSGPVAMAFGNSDLDPRLFNSSTSLSMSKSTSTLPRGTEANLLAQTQSESQPRSRLSIADLADRHIRERTDAIAIIIRNINEQCAAAVEGLQLARDADAETEIEADVEKVNSSTRVDQDSSHEDVEDDQHEPNESHTDEQIGRPKSRQTQGDNDNQAEQSQQRRPSQSHSRLSRKYREKQSPPRISTRFSSSRNSAPSSGISFGGNTTRTSDMFVGTGRSTTSMSGMSGMSGSHFSGMSRASGMSGYSTSATSVDADRDSMPWTPQQSHMRHPNHQIMAQQQQELKSANKPNSSIFASDSTRQQHDENEPEGDIDRSIVASSPRMKA